MTTTTASVEITPAKRNYVTLDRQPDFKCPACGTINPLHLIDHCVDHLGDGDNVYLECANCGEEQLVASIKPLDVIIATVEIEFKVEPIEPQKPTDV